jgi:Uma2 family endonuclease
MLIKDVDVEMDESVMAQLLALPYEFDVDDEGHIVMTPLQAPGLTWEELATIHPPLLPENLAWKVETDAQNRIIMSPQPTFEHQSFGTEIIRLFFKLLQDGRPFYECGVQTGNGTRVPDVGWISNERIRQQSQDPSYSLSPEICIEIISKSNTRREIDEKKRLYLEAGALEVWRCERDGKMNFFGPDGPLPASRICPDFPDRLKTIL